MLAQLCGSESVQAVLLSLFVNRKAYSTQIQRFLRASLTPIQKAFAKLEKAGIVTSVYEGKTRIYTFDSGYPLLEELEQLLKKAYLLLTPDQKKQYHFALADHRNHLIDGVSGKQIVDSFWKRLQQVQHQRIIFVDHGNHKSDASLTGQGNVKVTKFQNQIVLNAQGRWTQSDHSTIEFTNSYRFTFDQGSISLEHLRLGVLRPVFLFFLRPVSKNCLASEEGHDCNEDQYFGRLYLDKNGLNLKWRVLGPSKNQEINSHYY